MASEALSSGFGSRPQAPLPDGATPVIAQYLEIKAANADCLLFYRMGDFYELFFEDAEIASRALGIALTKRGKIGDGAERSSDQALDLLGAAGLLAGRGFAPCALGGGARQHAVFGRHPTPPLALEPRRHRLSRCRSAQHMGLAEADEARAFGMARDRPLEADGAKRVGRAF